MLEAFHIGIIDIIILVLMVLFGIGGFRHGFFKEVVGIAALIGAAVLSFLLADLAKETAIQSFQLDVTLFTSIRDIFSGNAVYDQLIDGSQPDALTLLTSGLTQIGLPALFASPLASILIEFNGTIGDALATASTNLVLTIGSYLLTFLLSWILLLVLGKQFVKLSKQNPIFKFIDSILGLVLGLGRAALLIVIAFSIGIALSFVLPEINEFFVTDLALDSESFSVGKFVYETIVSIFGTLL
jgi:uncharacterized membrane protein required for colicin V production